MVKSLYLVALQNAYCKPKTLVKRGFTEISRRAFFGTYRARVTILDKTFVDFFTF